MTSVDPSPLPEDLAVKVTDVPILVVGAGGIGCELLKNLVLTGFKNITIIDLDTIDTSNLNRQFLFQKRHVGQSKSKVARESALEFVPSAKIEAIHDSVTSSDYGVPFFKKFSVVFNALDNRAARSHVNRMCLAADVPLVESGTAGYLGQVTVIRKNETECYDCEPKPHQKSFPGCTIRNTPSEPIHCIVWSKHLFNQLFGESDPDEEVSPDSEDPEAGDKNGDAEDNEQTNGSKANGDSSNGDKNGHEAEKSKNSTVDNGNVVRISTRQWAIDSGYDPKLIFQKLFHDDIKYLLSMDKLWAKRRPPVPLDWEKLPGPKSDVLEIGLIRDQQMWNISHCAEIFADSVKKLSEKFKASDYKDCLVWDKDDESAMDFVASCANIRAQIFGIAQKSRFDIKSMAGNIIPAIATTNAVIAGCIVMEGIKILQGKQDRCKTIYLSKKVNPRGKILIPCQLNKPNPKCYVCSEKREVSVKVRLDKMTVKLFEDKILKGDLAMVAPDVEIETRGIILISSDADDDTQQNLEKTLKEMGVANGSILSCDDFLQDYNVKIMIEHSDDLEEAHDYELLKKDEPASSAGPSSPAGEAENEKDASATNNVAATPTDVTGKGDVADDDDDIMEVPVTSGDTRKRNASNDEVCEIVEMPATKKPKMDEVVVPQSAGAEGGDSDDDIVCLD